MSKLHLQAIVNLGYTLSVYYDDEMDMERTWEVKRSTDVDEVVDAVNNIEDSRIMVHKDRRVMTIHYLDQGNEDECIVDHTYKPEWHSPNHEHYPLMAIMECSSVEELQNHLRIQAQETNIEFVTRIMEFSKNGGVMQMFVIQCLDYYSQLVQSKSEKEIQKHLGMFINAQAWQRCADELQEELKRRSAL